jgi:hypothetical protein
MGAKSVKKFPVITHGSLIPSAVALCKPIAKTGTRELLRTWHPEVFAVCVEEHTKNSATKLGQRLQKPSE